MVARISNDDARCSTLFSDDVVEVPLLLSTRRMEALLALSRARGQSVAQIVRGLIDRELTTHQPGC